MTRAFVFPGQGSQAVGMGKELADAFSEAREVFDEIDEALGQNLSGLMFDGPEDELMFTENAQPALMAVSMAVIRVLRAEGGFCLAGNASHIAGHSLGEYSALAAAGVFSLADVARLLKTRGRAMQEAVPVGGGAMAALIGLSPKDAIAIATEAARDGVCDFANDNAPGQVVVSGSKVAVERAVDLAKDKGARRALLLPVSAPFHCALMAPAADVMAQALAGVTMTDPCVPVVANVIAKPVSDAVRARELLVEQVTGLGRWRECVLTMKDAGVTEQVEVGAGKVLSGLARRIDGALLVSNLGGPKDVAAFLEG